MSAESVRSLEKIRALLDARNEYVRYVRICDVQRDYGLGKKKVIRLAQDSGSYYVINKLAVVDIEVFDAYYRKQRL